MRVVIAAVVALVVSAAVAPLAARVATRFGVVDRPGALKVQDKPVPYLGGGAVAAGLAAGTAISGRWSLLVPAALALALGLADDLRNLPPWARLAGAAPVGMAVALVVETRFAVPLEFVLAVAVTVALINAVNMLYGLDGLAAGVTVASAAGSALLLEAGSRALAVALAAALLGFLWWNRPPARIYLGDAGAYLTGAALATLAAVAWRPAVPTARSVTAMALLAVPAWELVTTVIRRLRARARLTEGDREHTYDKLVRRGWPPTRAVAALIAAQLVVSSAATVAGLALA